MSGVSKSAHACIRTLIHGTALADRIPSWDGDLDALDHAVDAYQTGYQALDGSQQALFRLVFHIGYGDRFGPADLRDVDTVDEPLARTVWAIWTAQGAAA